MNIDTVDIKDSKNSERNILLFGILLFSCIIAGYAINRVFIFAALISIIVFELLSPTFETIVPFAIIVTWGAEIWSIGNSRLYTIIRLFSVFTILVKMYSKSIINVRRTTKFIILLFLFIVYIFIGNLISSNYQISKVLNLFICYLVIYLFAKNTDWLGLSDLTVAYGEGVILSSVISTLSASIPRLNAVVNRMIQTYNVYGALRLSRMSGLTYDPNLFGLYTSIGIVGNLCVAHRKRYEKCLANVLIAAILSVMGIMTLSKTFMIVLAVIGVAFVGTWISSRNISITRKIMIMSLLVIVMAAVVINAGTYFEAIAARFSRSNKGGITTGRSELWNYYLNMLVNNPLSLVFGKSIGFSLQEMSSPHNFIIYMLLHFGLVGSSVFVMMIIDLIKFSKTVPGVPYSYQYKMGFYNYLPLVVYFVFSLSIDPFMLYDAKMIMLSICFASFSVFELQQGELT